MNKYCFLLYYTNSNKTALQQTEESKSEKTKKSDQDC